VVTVEPCIASGRTITVRLWKGLLVGMVALGLAGCTSSASTSSPTAAVTARTTAPPPAPVPPGAKAAAQAAAAQFDSVYFTSRFAAAWRLLAPDVQRQVPENVWVRVHESCPSSTSGLTRTIKAVTVFGTTAIVTETVLHGQSRPTTVENVFYNADGHWGYAPVYLGIYRNGSIAADIAAAKAAGLCASWKAF
jgi:hypothetical protein